MSTGVFSLLGINLGIIGLLPFVFFKAGRHNAMWWATAGPLFLCAALVLLGWRGWLEAWAPGTADLVFLRELLAVALSAGSIWLLGFTLATHRTRIALWHQDHDAPSSLITDGAYARVRHPFYSSFLCVLLAVGIAIPHPLTLLNLVWGGLMLRHTATREERRLTSSEFGSEYSAYIRRTGRFFPRLGGRNA